MLFRTSERAYYLIWNRKVGRGKLFYDNLPFFLIVNKELNCIFSICSKCQTCSWIIWIVKIKINIIQCSLAWTESYFLDISVKSGCLTILCRTRQYRVLYLPIDHQHRFLPRQKHTFCTNIVRCVHFYSRQNQIFLRQ